MRVRVCNWRRRSGTCTKLLTSREAALPTARHVAPRAAPTLGTVAPQGRPVLSGEDVGVQKFIAELAVRVILFAQLNEVGQPLIHGFQFGR